MTNMKHALHCLILLAVLAAAAAEEEPRWTVGTAEQLQQAATNPTGSNAAVDSARRMTPNTRQSGSCFWQRSTRFQEPV